MLRPKKKITKKELKHDPVVSTYQRALTLYYDNKKYIGYALAAFFTLALGLVVYANNIRADNERAAAELGKVFPLYDAGQYNQAIDGVPESGIMGLRAIVENYKGESSRLARFYLANAYYQLGNYDEALKQFLEFTGGDELLRASALAGAAACYEAKGNRAEAARYYEKAVDTAPRSPAAAEYLSLAAYNYGLSGEKDRAVALYRKVRKEYPTSSYAREADRYIVQFSL